MRDLWLRLPRHVATAGLSLLLVASAVLLAAGQPIRWYTEPPEPPRVLLYLFWAEGCPHCQEARAFLGLPDVGPMQEKLMAQMQERISENLTGMDPETLIRTWMPIGMEGLEKLQSAFWSQMAGAAKPPSGKGKS